MRRAPLLLAILALGACSTSFDYDPLRSRLPDAGQDAEVVVEDSIVELLAYTDVPIGGEGGFDAVEVTEGSQTYNFSSTGNWTLDDPRSLREFEVMEGDELDITITLSFEGSAVLERRVVYTAVAGPQQLVVPLTRNCLGVTCGFGSTCVDGGCVNPACILGTEEVCTGCVPAVPPGPPTDPDDPSDAMSITFGLRDPKVDPATWGPRADELTYDLDGLCTRGASTFACAASASAVIVADGPNGEDNTFVKQVINFVNLVAQYPEGTSFQSEASQLMLEGLNTPLIHVEGWNGTRNDPSVDLWLSVAANVQRENAETMALEDAQPMWDGADYFAPRADDFRSGDITQVNSENRATSAYIIDGLLVARLAGSGLRFPVIRDTPSFFLRLTEGYITGEISEDGTRLDNVIIAGRANLDAVFDSLVDSVCVDPDSPRLPALVSMLEGFADLPDTSNQDGSDAACTSMSAGLGFSGYRVNLAEDTAPPEDNEC